MSHQNQNFDPSSFLRPCTRLKEETGVSYHGVQRRPKEETTPASDPCVHPWKKREGLADYAATQTTMALLCFTKFVKKKARMRTIDTREERSEGPAEGGPVMAGVGTCRTPHTDGPPVHSSLTTTGCGSLQQLYWMVVER